MRGRKPSIKSPYYLPEHCYDLARQYALNYHNWMAEIWSLRDQSKAIVYDKDKVQSNSSYNPTEAAAVAISELQKKVDIIDESIAEASDGLDYYIRLAVCNEYSFKQLTNEKLKMPLNKNEFGRIKQKFYYILYNKI